MKTYFKYCSYLNWYLFEKTKNLVSYWFLRIEKENKSLTLNEISDKVSQYESELFYLEQKDTELWDEIYTSKKIEDWLTISKLIFVSKFDEVSLSSKPNSPKWKRLGSLKKELEYSPGMLRRKKSVSKTSKEIPVVNFGYWYKLSNELFYQMIKKACMS